MVLSRAQPPAPAGTADAADNAARLFQKRVLDYNRKTANLLEYLKIHGSGIPKQIIEFIQVSWFLIDALFHFPVEDTWKIQLNKIQYTINNIKKDTNKLTAKTENPIQIYAQAAARTSLLYYYQLIHNFNNTAPARSADFDCKYTVTVKINNSAIAKNLRRLISEDLVKYTKKYRKNTVYKAISPMLMSIQFIAAKILQSDNLQFFLCSTKKAEIACIYRDAWIRGFGNAVQIILPI